MPDFKFQPIIPYIWQGRYKKPMGEGSAYHVNVNNQIEVRWIDEELFQTYICPINVTPAISKLSEVVNQIKSRENGQPGGSFVINEFGQVLVPNANNNNIYSVGEGEGTIYFQDVRNNNDLISLNDDDALECGDAWDRPYMGMKYRLSATFNDIYYWDDRNDMQHHPHIQDLDLIDNLRQVRPPNMNNEFEPMSFIVNQYGIVVAKKQIGNHWKPCYVGRIDYDQWFERED